MLLVVRSKCCSFRGSSRLQNAKKVLKAFSTLEPDKVQGKITQVFEGTVDVEFPTNHLPSIYDALEVKNFIVESVDLILAKNKPAQFPPKSLVLEVRERISPSTVRCAAMDTTQGLARGYACVPRHTSTLSTPSTSPTPPTTPLTTTPVSPTTSPTTPTTTPTTTFSSICVPLGNSVSHRLMSPIGDPLDRNGPFQTEVYPVRTFAQKSEIKPLSNDRIITGIKVLDFLCPIPRGGKIGIFGGSGTGKTILLMELMNNIRNYQNVYAMNMGTSLGRDLYREVANVPPSSQKFWMSPFVLSQMDEPVASHSLMPFTGITLAERIHERDPAETGMLYLDLHHSFTCESPELDAVLNRLPTGDFTSIQTIHTTGADFSDAPILSKFDATIVLSQALSAVERYPAVDPLFSTSRMLTPEIVGQEHYDLALRVKKILADYKNLISKSRVGKLTSDEKLTLSRTLKIRNFLSQPFSFAEIFTKKFGKVSSLEETVQGVKEILEGKFDEISDSAFYMIGPISQVEREVKRIEEIKLQEKSLLEYQLTPDNVTKLQKAGSRVFEKAAKRAQSKKNPILENKINAKQQKWEESAAKIAAMLQREFENSMHDYETRKIQVAK